MDYSKSGGTSGHKSSPLAKRGTQKGAPKTDDKAAAKAALLARMKAAAQKPKP